MLAWVEKTAVKKTMKIIANQENDVTPFYGSYAPSLIKDVVY